MTRGDDPDVPASSPAPGNTTLPTAAPAAEGGAGYQPDPLSPAASYDALRDEVRAIGCVFVLSLPAFVFVAELLRNWARTALWWPMLASLFVMAPVFWLLWRFWQNPALLDRALPQLDHAARRRSVASLGVAMVVLRFFQLYGSALVGWLNTLL